MDFRPIALILAAGSASRFGSPKQIAKLNGSTLIEHAVANVSQSGCSNIYMITGAWRKKVEVIVHPLRIGLIHHVGWEEGQQSSVRFGLIALMMIPDWNYLHLFPVDMPWYTAKYFRMVNKVAKKKGKGETLVATEYPDSYRKQGPGLPLLLPRKFVEDYLADVAKHPELSLRKAVADYPKLETLPAGPHTKDIDRPEDLP